MNAAAHAPSRWLEGIDAVLFDLDGVLLDTEPLYTEATRSVLGPAADAFDWRLKERMMGRSPHEAARIAIEALGLPLTPEEYVRAKRPVLLDLFTRCSPKPGARELVHYVHGRGIPMVVATSSERSFFEAKTGHHDFFALFSGVVCGSDPTVKAHKPAPDIFLEAARLVGVAPARCLVFEDSPAGVEAANRAGVRRVIALVDENLDPTLVASADLSIRTYDELAR